MIYVKIVFSNKESIINHDGNISPVLFTAQNTMYTMGVETLEEFIGKLLSCHLIRILGPGKEPKYYNPKQIISIEKWEPPKSPRTFDITDVHTGDKGHP